MATTIQIKRNSVLDAVPLPGELAQGELAVNLVNKKLYTKDHTDTVVQLLGNEGDPGEGLYVPLVGTSPGNHITGLVGWNVGAQDWQIGILQGVFDDYLSIGAGSQNTGTTGINLIGNEAGSGQSNFFFRGDGVALFKELILDPNSNTSDNLGFTLSVVGTAGITAAFIESVTQTDTLRVISDAHIGSTDGPGAYTLAVTGDTNLIGNMVCQGGITAVGEVFGVGNIGSTEGQVVIGASTPTATNHATRKDYVDNGLAGKSSTSHSHSSFGTLSVTNLTTTGFYTMSAFAGVGSSAFVRCNNSGTFFATAGTLLASEVEVSPGVTLADWVAAAAAEINSLGGTI